MNPERRSVRPGEGTKMLRVLELLEKGKSFQEIVAETGFSKRAVTYCRYDIYTREVFPRPSSEQRKEERRASHARYPHTPETIAKLAAAKKGKRPSDEVRRKISLAKGGTWVAIERYARWGMSSREITEAIGESLSFKQVSNALQKAKRRGEVSQLTKEGSRGILRDRYHKKEIQQRVALWLEVGNILAENGLEEIPTKKDDWLLLIRFYRARREMGMTGDNGAMATFRREFDNLLPETQERIQPWIYLIREKTRTNTIVDPTKLAGAMAVSGEIRLGELG